MKLIFPDPLWNVNIASGAIFLYFNEEKIGLTLHPSVSTFLTGVDPFDFIDFVHARHPVWVTPFDKLIKMWRIYRESLERTSQLINSLKEQ